jgi:fatty acid desaturase
MAPTEPSPDRRPQGIESDKPRRRIGVLAVATAVLVGCGALFVALGVPWWIPTVFVVLVLAAIVVST